jgi:hypothetical protein
MCGLCAVESNYFLLLYFTIRFCHLYTSFANKGSYWLRNSAPIGQGTLLLFAEELCTLLWHVILSFCPCQTCCSEPIILSVLLFLSCCLLFISNIFLTDLLFRSKTCCPLYRITFFSMNDFFSLRILALSRTCCLLFKLN